MSTLIYTESKKRMKAQRSNKNFRKSNQQLLEVSQGI